SVVRPAPSPPTTALTLPGTARKVTWSRATLSPYRTHASSVPHHSCVAVAAGPVSWPGDGAVIMSSPRSRARLGRPARPGRPAPRDGRGGLGPPPPPRPPPPAGPPRPGAPAPAGRGPGPGGAGGAP